MDFLGGAEPVTTREEAQATADPADQRELQKGMKKARGKGRGLLTELAEQGSGSKLHGSLELEKNQTPGRREVIKPIPLAAEPRRQFFCFLFFLISQLNPMGIQV